jgi:hypothetical protein
LPCCSVSWLLVELFRVLVSLSLSLSLSPNVPDRLYGPPNFLPNGYRGVSARGLRDRVVNIITHLQLTPWSTKRVIYTCTPTCVFIV